MESVKSVQKQASPGRLAPTKLIGQYEDFITNNSSSVGQIESALRSLTYIIPGRFRESEIASESLHSVVQLLSLYHDSLVGRAIAKLPATIPRANPTPHARYTKFWSNQSMSYRRVALVLQMIQYTELLWEMMARRRGEKVRWRVVTAIEILKAICRFVLLRLTNSRPLVSPPLPEREIDPRITQQQELDVGDPEESESESTSSETSWVMPRTGLALPALPEAGNVSSYLISKVLTADDVKPPRSLLRRTVGKGQFAEILYILRPLIYVLALRKWSHKKNSWAPWLIGFGMEFGCRQLAKKDFRERVAGGLRGLTGLEREELRKRWWSLGWWVMRGAFYENITKTYLKGTIRRMKGKILLDLAGSVLEDYAYLWDNYYFSTSTL